MLRRKTLLHLCLTYVLLNDEVILGPTFYLAKYILQVVRYADPRTATKLARLQDPHVPHPVQLVLRVDLLHFGQYRARHLHVLLRKQRRGKIGRRLKNFWGRTCI